MESVAAEQAAEKGLMTDEFFRRLPSGAKAHDDFRLLTARLKSCPFKAMSFSATYKARKKTVVIKGFGATFFGLSRLTKI
jgi:hypothetical protein